LFTKIAKIQGLGLCQLSFYVEDKKFIICAINDLNQSYFIKIESIEEIMKLQNFYKNYDQMIVDIIYEESMLKLHNKEIGDLKHTSKTFQDEGVINTV